MASCDDNAPPPFTSEQLVMIDQIVEARTTVLLRASCDGSTDGVTNPTSSTPGHAPSTLLIMVVAPATVAFASLAGELTGLCGCFNCVSAPPPSPCLTSHVGSPVEARLTLSHLLDPLSLTIVTRQNPGTGCARPSPTGPTAGRYLPWALA